MQVRILQMGVGTKEVQCPIGSTIKEVLDQAGVSYDGHSVYMDHRQVNIAQQAEDGASLTLSPKMKAGEHDQVLEKLNELSEKEPARWEVEHRDGGVVYCMDVGAKVPLQISEFMPGRWSVLVPPGLRDDGSEGADPVQALADFAERRKRAMLSEIRIDRLGRHSWLW